MVWTPGEILTFQEIMIFEFTIKNYDTFQPNWRGPKEGSTRGSIRVVHRRSPQIGDVIHMDILNTAIQITHTNIIYVYVLCNVMLKNIEISAEKSFVMFEQMKIRFKKQFSRISYISVKPWLGKVTWPPMTNFFVMFCSKNNQQNIFTFKMICQIQKFSAEPLQM